jgi:hypothetical protein
MNGPSEIHPNASQGSPESKYPGSLRAVAFIVLVVGAIGSLGLMFRAGQQTPGFLLVLFTIWVLSPFVALLWGSIVSKRWSVATQVTLYWVTLVVTLASLAIYGELVDIRPPGSANAFLFVAVPPASCVFMTIVVAMAAFISRRLSSRGAAVR